MSLNLETVSILCVSKSQTYIHTYIRAYLCTFGYVISRNGVFKLLQQAVFHSSKPIDHVLDEEVLNGRLLAFHAHPPFVHKLTTLSSTLAYWAQRSRQVAVILIMISAPTSRQSQSPSNPKYLHFETVRCQHSSTCRKSRRERRHYVHMCSQSLHIKLIASTIIFANTLWFSFTFSLANWSVCRQLVQVFLLTVSKQSAPRRRLQLEQIRVLFKQGRGQRHWPLRTALRARAHVSFSFWIDGISEDDRLCRKASINSFVYLVLPPIWSHYSCVFSSSRSSTHWVARWDLLSQACE